MNELRSAFCQASKRNAVLSIVFIVVLVFLASLDFLVDQFRRMSLLPSHYHNKFILNSIRSDTIAPFIPILSTLPFSSIYIDDIKSQFIRVRLIRSNYKSYLCGRIFTCFVLGGGVLVAGIIIAWSLSILLLLPMERLSEESFDALSELNGVLFLLFLNGGLWSVMGMAMSSIMESKYIAHISPFVFYYLLVIISERYFFDIYLLYPRNWISTEAWPYGYWGISFFLIEITLILSLLFIYKARKKILEQ